MWVFKNICDNGDVFHWICDYHFGKKIKIEGYKLILNVCK